MDVAVFWLPIIGAGIFITIACGAWYGGNKILAIWLGFAGCVCLLATAALQIQQTLRDQTPTQIGARTDSTMSFGAVLLNSPGPGQVTAWIRIKNTGPTPAYHAKGWHKFIRGLGGQNPFGDVLEFENDAILGPGQEVNQSSTLPLSTDQLAAIKDKTLSFYVWGRIEYTDETKQPQFFSFKTIMNGNTDIIVVDGIRAEGWGLRPTPGGFDAN